MAEEHEGEIVFVGVSNNDTIEDGKGYVERFDVPYAMAHSPETWRLYDVPYQPVTIVLDAKHTIHERILGAVSYEQLEGVLEEVTG